MTQLTLEIAEKLLSFNGAYVTLVQNGRNVGMYRLIQLASSTEVWLYDKLDGDTFVVPMSSVQVSSSHPSLTR